MARKKKTLSDYDNQPSLFDAFSIPGLNTDPIEKPKSMEQRIRVAAAGHRTATEVQPLGHLNQDPRILFISFGSGSSGNCAYLGTRSQGVLIDAGIDDRKVEAELQRNRLSMDAVKGILLTHDHSDHIRYAYALLRRHRHMQLYCTPRVLNGILNRHNVTRRLKDYHHPIYKETEFNLGGFKITAFEVDHDGSDNAGFFITCPGFNFAVATDLGHVGARADYYMRQASYLMIESNYDLDMLHYGRYPEYLKARIKAGNGHMDNADTAAYVSSIYSPSLKYIFLCHLSNDNNTPDKALSEMKRALATIGVTPGDGSNSPEACQAPVQVMALPRYDSTGIVTLRIEK